MPLSCSQQLPEYKRLIDEIKEKLTINERMTGELKMTNKRRLFNCDKRQIKTHKLHYESP